MTLAPETALVTDGPPGATRAPGHTPAPGNLPPRAAPSTSRVEIRLGRAWHPVCEVAQLTPGRGVAVLLPDGRQAAVFLDRAGGVYAIGNQDPFTGAWVLSRGLLGRAGAGGRPFVASPLLKQRFDLGTGACLDDGTVSVPAFAVRTR